MLDRLFFKGPSGPPGGFTLFTPQTVSFVVPAGVNSISAVTIGAGGGGATGNSLARGGGGGGALAWTPSISVTPGETLTLVVGAGGTTPTAGGDTSISRGGTTLLLAKGGTSGTSYNGGTGGSAVSSVGTNKFSGGNGGGTNNGSGGGAAGYTGDGGGSNNSGAGTGGGAGRGGVNAIIDQGGDVCFGGGTFPFGNSGFSGVAAANNQRGGFGSTIGGTSENSYLVFPGAFSSFLGAGGGGGYGIGFAGANGGSGAIRILWGTANATTSAIPPAVPTVYSSQFFRSNAQTPPIVTIPAGIETGDLILLYQMVVRSDSGSPTEPGAPTNFQAIRSSTLSFSGNYQTVYTLSQRLVLNAAIAGTSITIPSQTFGTTTIALIVLRGVTGINTYVRTVGETFRTSGTTVNINNSTTFTSDVQTLKGIPITLAFLNSPNGYTPTTTWGGGTSFTTGLVGFNAYYKIYSFSTTVTDDTLSATYSVSDAGSGLMFNLLGY